MIESEVIIHHPQLGIVHLAAPLERVRDVARLRDAAEGFIRIGICDCAVALVEFRHVFGEVEAVSEPAARRLDGQRTRGDAFRRVPQDVPEGIQGVAREVERGDLEVTPVEVALVAHDGGHGFSRLGVGGGGSTFLKTRRPIKS